MVINLDQGCFFQGKTYSIKIRKKKSDPAKSIYDYFLGNLYRFSDRNSFHNMNQNVAGSLKKLDRSLRMIMKLSRLTKILKGSKLEPCSLQRPL